MVPLRAAFAFVLCSCARSPAPEAPVPLPTATQPPPQTLDALVEDGVGFGGARLDMKRAELDEKLGAPAHVVQHERYSIELDYPNGVHAYTCFGDSDAKIFYLEATAPLRVATTRGIMLGKSTMRDVFRAYGKGKWLTSDGEDFWRVEYDDLGVGFAVDRILSLPQFPLDEARHLDQPIVKITIPSERGCLP